MSVRNPERNRNTRTKLKTEPRSSQELIQDVALFREQTVEFFVSVRGLQNSGLNPKSSLDTTVVTAEDLEEVWGKVSSYRTTNTKLHPDTRRELISLYGKIYETQDVTNNEFMLWIVKGFILECKGEAIDWATAATSTAREKADRCQRELDKMRLPDSPNSSGGNLQGAAGVSGGNLASYSFGKKCVKLSTKLANGRRAVSSIEEAIFSSNLSEERRPVSEVDLAAVEDLLKLESQLLDTVDGKVSFLAEVRKKEADRIIGLRYSMDDRKSAVEESEESVKVIQSSLLGLDAKISATTQTVSCLEDLGFVSRFTSLGLGFWVFEICFTFQVQDLGFRGFGSYLTIICVSARQRDVVHPQGLDGLASALWV